MLFRMGDLLRARLAEPEQAVDRLGETLGIDPSHADAEGTPDAELSRRVTNTESDGELGDALKDQRDVAERLDTVVGIFGINQKPTGEKDPFGLRRATIGILRILKEHRLPLVLNDLLQLAADGLVEKIENRDVITEVRDYMLERLRGIYADEGMQADLFNAVAELEPDTLSDFDQRIRAVAAFRDLPEAESLAAANKRIRNIVRKAEEEIPGEIAKRLFKLSQERALAELILKTRKEVEPLLEEKNYSEALKTLAGLRERVDDFFDNVMVMDKNREIRQNRLAILKQLGDMFLEVADISQLQS